MPAAKLRAAAWQSIFTHDMRRYRRVMYDRMGDITTLITYKHARMTILDRKGLEAGSCECYATVKAHFDRLGI